jgi:hypothetical protein
MEMDSNFSAARGNEASSAKRSASASKALSDETSFAHWPALQQILQNLPDSRPEAVARARKLIADPDYPSQHTQQILARHLAIQLTAEIDPLPT